MLRFDLYALHRVIDETLQLRRRKRVE